MKSFFLSTVVALTLVGCSSPPPPATPMTFESADNQANAQKQISLEGYMSLPVAALVSDPREQVFEPSGLVTLEDAETGATRLVDTRSAAYRAEVTRAFDARRAQVSEQLRSSGVDVLAIDAQGSVVEPLLQFFRERERRGRHR